MPWDEKGCTSLEYSNTRKCLRERDCNKRPCSVTFLGFPGDTRGTFCTRKSRCSYSFLPSATICTWTLIMYKQISSQHLLIQTAEGRLLKSLGAIAQQILLVCAKRELYSMPIVPSWLALQLSVLLKLKGAHFLTCCLAVWLEKPFSLSLSCGWLPQLGTYPWLPCLCSESSHNLYRGRGDSVFTGAFVCFFFNRLLLHGQYVISGSFSFKHSGAMHLNHDVGARHLPAKQRARAGQWLFKGLLAASHQSTGLEDHIFWSFIRTM